ncbi:uncharacterized protein EV154DRAFT_486628 [Mucor mucedo]|uniref:uncharacterized protein n=1 Tax=Mucor mucedo TaxID=29922 RepID=UPI00221FEECE|nr:uncharacterized protein EV154DRAFT_486628 [Mucor mucedo]KAI7875838.1 hypothetical protein EV154DRAFT_486628 [Mucor mucedo]
MRATFFYKDRQENLLNELGERVFDPTEDVLTQVDDLNVALGTITNREFYLSAKNSEKVVYNLTKSAKLCNLHNDLSREAFTNRMLKQPQEYSLVAKAAKGPHVKYRTALNWWHIYEDMKRIPYKKSEQNRICFDLSRFYTRAQLS